jgi:hypothetical protein
LTALAVLILAVAVVAVRAGSTGTVEAATGTIDVLNVGTCYTTDTDVFKVGSCNDGDETEGYKVAERSAITKVDSVFATYAIDPKTSGDEPRAIAKNADVIKVSIEDTGRDKRTGKIYAVETPSPVTQDLSPELSAVIRDALGDLANELLVDPDTTNEDTEERVVRLSSPTAIFDRLDDDDGVIEDSGDAQFGLAGDESTDHPMAPEDAKGKFYWFGLGPDDDGDTTPDFVNLTGEFVNLDEDQSSGTINRIAPWMRVTAQIPADIDITVQYIYYQTSDEEELFGGAKMSDYDTSGNPVGAVSPVFVDDENDDDADEQDALVLRAGGDGNAPAQNLWLKEQGRFSGRYEGYLRLTDADGDGSAVDNPNTTADEFRPKSNWGLVVDAASGPDMPRAAVLGVESGPVTISYKNSNGDIRTVAIQIDKEPPSIQIDSPAHNAASKDDSPELLGSFSDGGSSGLREDSFKIYADNRPDEKTDANPVFDLRVNDDTMTTDDRGYVCVDADEDADGACESDGVAALRGHYAGFSVDSATYGIISSAQVYLPEDSITGEDDTDGAVDEYKTGDAEDFEDGDAAGLFDTVVRIDFPPDEDDGRRYNHIIDLQAVVMDIAGNIGFSDSEPSDPTFIHDLGTTKDGNKRDDVDQHNVIGWYSRHVYFLDDVDPKYSADESATGFFVNSDGDVMASSSGLMVDFDGKIDDTTVGVGTFEVELDDGTAGTVTDVAVDGDKVYLMLESELAPNATPKVDLGSGQSISDLAGNESTDRRLDGIELSDGILPTFTITLSGGSGLNEDIDGQGSSELTKEQMKISIVANEPIQGAPQFAVVCSNLTWGKASDENDVATFASNRMGSFVTGTIDKKAPSAKYAIADPDGDPDDDTVPAAERTMCPDHTDDPDTGIVDDVSTFFEVDVARANRRSGNLWEFDWSNLTGDQAVENGKLSVIVWGRDRSSYLRGSDRIQNWSSSTSGFTYDTVLKAAWDGDDDGDKGELIPESGENVFEPRPFVLLDFGDEETKVDVTTFEIDAVDQVEDLQELDDNEFVWWPDPLDYGTYEVYVEANDGADNQGEHTYKFTVKERAPFVLDLLAGWNSISFPANPIDRALHAVFTNDAVDQVVGWNVTEPVSPWRMATRIDGVWTTSDEYGTLNDVEARYGYWVHSTGFITQAVRLAGKGDRSTDGQPNPADIPTDEGWNFVGVVDVDGDQTQDDAGETLRNSVNDPITAAEYLGDYVRAYTWDHVNNTWDVLKKDEGITIGTGVWVYYGSGVAP